MPSNDLLRPLVFDLFHFLWPVLVGVGAYFLGRWFHRWSVAVRAGMIGGTVGGICIIFAALFHAIPPPVEAAFSHVGGVIVVLCWMGLGVHGLRMAGHPSAFFLEYVVLAALLALIVVESGGSLWFRLQAVETWHNYPRETGLLSQTTNMTCLPASSAMMLKHYGYDAVSEGELAYLANTSFFGTDAHVMARAITQKIQRPGAYAEMTKTTFQELIDRGRPFIATVQREHISSHSIYVKQISANTLLVFDPDVNYPAHRSAADFLAEWTGNAIVIHGIEPIEGIGE